MKIYTIVLALFFPLMALAAPQKINSMYVNTYGSATDPALLFVHGGPGFDSQDFESSTAAILAAQGFYVVVYDQRGQGRSDIATSPNDYNYKQYADDLKAIIDQLQLTKPVLIGHSHGGPISLKFDQAYPGVASKIILVSGPIDFFRSLSSLRINCSSRYTAVGDSGDMSKINSDWSALNGTPSLTDEVTAIADIFTLGINKPCDVYIPVQPTAGATALRALVKQKYVTVAKENLQYPMTDFVVNEQYIHVDQTAWVKAHADHIFGIYGSEDGLFTPAVLADIQTALAGNSSPFSYQLVSGSSHMIYIDKQDEFIAALKNALK